MMKNILLIFLLTLAIFTSKNGKAEVTIENKIDTILMRSLINHALIIRNSNPDSARLILNEIVEKTQQLKNHDLWIQACINIALIEKQKGNKLKADSIYRTILKIKSIKESPHYGKIKLDHAHLAYLLGQYENAERIYQEIIPYLKANRKHELLIQCYINKAKIKIKQNEFTLAMENFIIAIELAEQYKLPNKQAQIYGNMGRLYFRQQTYDESMHYFEKSLTIHTQLNNIENIAVCYQSIGTLYIIKEEYSNAETQLNKAGEFFKQSERTNKYLNVLNNLGVMYKRQKKYTKAKEKYNEVLAITNTTDNTIYQAIVLQNLSQVNFELGMSNLAIKQLNEAILLSKKNGETDFREAYLNMAIMYEEIENFKLAYTWLNLYKTHADSVFNIDKFKETENLRNKYEAEKKELLIDKILLENDNKQATILSGKIIIASSTIATLVLIIFLLTLKKKNKVVNESYNKLIKQSEQLSMAHKTIRNESLKTQIKKTAKNEDKHDKSSIPEELRECILTHLDILINKEHFYKNIELNITESAKLLNTNTKYLSQIINESFDATFPNFINQLRIEEAQRLLKNTSKNNLTLEEIGFQSGFKSKSVFNTAFKRITGLTPSVYKKQIQQLN